MNKLVCFDIGNVLVRLGPSLRFLALPEGAGELQWLYHRYCVGEIDTTCFFDGIGRLYRWSRTREELEAWFIHTRLLGLQPGAEELLEELHSYAVPVGLLSNTNAAHWGYLKTFRSLQCCPFKVLSFQQQCAKPDARIFRRLEVSSGYSGGQILFFDDLEENVFAARALGWVAHRVDSETAIDDVRRLLRRHKIL
jgi:putative hydrolase of the HAD superfamily